MVEPSARALALDPEMTDTNTKPDTRSTTEPERVTLSLTQLLASVLAAVSASIAASPDVRAAVSAAEAELGEAGRILLRPSGTEQLVRVMVEAASQERAEQIARRVSEVVGAV